VWISFGNTNQERWQFVLYLGPARARESIDWAAMLPAEDVTGWLSLDFETKFMTVKPLEAHVDGEARAKGRGTF
jgi:hypothetical protein